jgi:hypothetical protein
MAEKGGTCLFLGEECCCYPNQSGLAQGKIAEIRTTMEKW